MKQCLLLALLLIIFFTGCYDRRELDDLAIVVGLGVDLADDGDILATVEIVNPQVLGNKSAGGGGEPVWVIESKGQTLFEAIWRMIHQSPNKLFFSHNQIIVIGEELANKDIFLVTDFLLRDEEPREDAYLIVAEGKAGDIIRAKIGIGSVPALAIEKMISSNWATSQAPMSQLIAFAKQTVAKAPGVVLGRIALRSEKEAEISFNGAAVLKRNKLVDWLTETEARGYLWIKDQVKGGTVVVKDTKYGGNISYEIAREKTVCRPKILQNGQMSIEIDIAVTSRFAGLTDSREIENPTAWSEYVLDLEEGVKREVRSVIDKAQTLQLDFLDFGALIKQYYPQIWQKKESNWDKEFPMLPVAIKVKAQINSVGMVKRSR